MTTATPQPNEPAFPTSAGALAQSANYPGMDLRTYIAAKCLPMMMQAEQKDIANGHTGPKFQSCAIGAVKYADALIAALAEPSETEAG